jgi:predicted MFS family arabinose efflux permease
MCRVVDSLCAVFRVWPGECMLDVLEGGPSKRIMASSPAVDQSSSVSNNLSKGLLATLTFTAGAAVANLYYSQPMLGLIAKDFHASAKIGLVAMCTQFGYTVGLILLVPLGDRVDRRRLILAQCAVLVLATAACALAASLTWLAIASVVVGIGATIAQLVIPLAADLARPETRGRAIGVVYSGVLTGILLARTLSGAVGQAFGWRAMFWCAAAIAFALGTVLYIMLPPMSPKSSIPYRELLKSMIALWHEHPLLRRACLIQACLFGVFSAFWSVLALLLERPPYNMGAAVAGAFGIVGLVGVAAASLGGRLTDRYGARNGVGVGIVASAAAFIIFALVPSLAGLVAGVIILDFGLSLSQVSNQSLILGLSESARSRINTIYVTMFFFGGAFGSGTASLAWQHGGWFAVSILGFVLTLVALAIHIYDRMAVQDDAHAGEYDPQH